MFELLAKTILRDNLEKNLNCLSYEELCKKACTCPQCGKKSYWTIGNFDGITKYRWNCTVCTWED